MGLITDTLGLTKNAEGELAQGAEDAVDLLGDGFGAVVDTIDAGLDTVGDTIAGTGDEIAEKGVIGAVGDGVVDAVDMVTDFVGDAVDGIAGGVKDVLNWVSGESPTEADQFSTHRVAIVVGELIGDEKSLGLRIENRVVTAFTKPQAEQLGWRLGDSIIAVGMAQVVTQEEMLAQIASAKEALKSEGTKIRFLVERLGARPAGPKPGQMISIQGRAAMVKGQDPQTGMMVVQFQDDGSMARVRGRP